MRDDDQCRYVYFVRDPNAPKAADLLDSLQRVDCLKVATQSVQLTNKSFLDLYGPEPQRYCDKHADLQREHDRLYNWLDSPEGQAEVWG